MVVASVASDAARSLSAFAADPQNSFAKKVASEACIEGVKTLAGVPPIILLLLSKSPEPPSKVDLANAVVLPPWIIWLQKALARFKTFNIMGGERSATTFE